VSGPQREDLARRGVSVRLRGVGKSFVDGARSIEVLHDIDLDLAPGELTAIVGPSGSGKSTLLHVIGGLERADRGEIEVDGRRWDQFDERRLAAERSRTLGFVFQFHQLLPDFTAVENVALPGRIAGRPAAAARERAAALLSEVGLADRLSHFPSELSGGERQRVALCRALFLEPPLLLADEPTGNLDPAAAEAVFELFLDLRARQGTTTVLVTHNPDLARRCATIRRLEGGRLEPITFDSA
jgi:lipoprotein-releasing system ATP-binding protein